MRKTHAWMRALFVACAGALVASGGCGPDDTDTASATSALGSEDQKAIDLATKYLDTRARELRIDPRTLVARPNVFRDLVGGTHVWFRHVVRGARVVGSELVVHADRKGRMTLTDAFVRDLPAPEAAKYTPDAAVTRARALANAPSDARVKRRELVIDPETRRFAYEIELGFTAKGGDAYLAPALRLDAQSLTVTRRWTWLETDAISLPAHGHFAGDVNVDVDRRPDGTFELRDLTRGEMLVRNGAGCADAWGTPLTGPAYTSSSVALGDGAPFYSVNNFWLGAAPLPPYLDTLTTQLHPSCAALTLTRNGETAPVDLLHHHAVAYDLYKHVFHRLGTDGANKQLDMLAHLDNLFLGPLNAFYQEDCDDVTPGEQQCSAYLSFYGPRGATDPQVAVDYARRGITNVTGIEALDVVAHELTHGVTHYTADLEYDQDAGGLNESYSDVFGTVAEFYGRGGQFDRHGTTIPNSAPGADFDIGEDLSPSFRLRSMTRPSAEGSEYASRSFDSWSGSRPFVGGDPHLTSGPGNRAFRFLAHGGAATSLETFTPLLPEGLTGIGLDLAARIWYQAYAYLTSRSNYLDMRAAVKQAASDLGHPAGSAVQTQIALAFDAINVGDAHPAPTSRFVTGDVEPNGGVGNAGLATLDANARITATLDTMSFMDADTLIAGVVSEADTTDLYTFYLDAGAERVVTVDAPCTGKIDGSDPVVVRVRGADGHPAVQPITTETADTYVITCGAPAVIPIHNFVNGQGTRAGDPVVAYRTAITVAISLAVSGDAEPRPYNLDVNEARLEAIADAYSLPPLQDAMTVDAAHGVLANDVFTPGAYTSYVTYPTLGYMLLRGDGSFDYHVNQPNTGTFSQADTLTYALTLGAMRSAPAEILITIPGRFRPIHVFPIPFKPYRYRGCPEPGPQPWRDVPAIVIGSKEQAIELVFPSAVPLRLSVEGESRGRVKIGERNQLIYVPPSGGFETDRLNIAIEDQSCRTTYRATLTISAR